MLDKKDFVSYGRINLDDYSWFDRGNCHFCAYANGITHMISATLDLMGGCDINALDELQKKRWSAFSPGLSFSSNRSA